AGYILGHQFLEVGISYFWESSYLPPFDLFQALCPGQILRFLTFLATIFLGILRPETAVML
ncbi:MAG: hypothetical protein ACXVIT_10405, partial [Halobacteriota archaeon]